MSYETWDASPFEAAADALRQALPGAKVKVNPPGAWLGTTTPPFVEARRGGVIATFRAQWDGRLVYRFEISTSRTAPRPGRAKSALKRALKDALAALEVKS